MGATPPDNSPRIFHSWQPPSDVALAYGILYVSITLAIGHTVRIDWLALPTVGLWGLTAGAQRLGALQRRMVFLGFVASAAAVSVVAAVLS